MDDILTFFDDLNDSVIVKSNEASDKMGEMVEEGSESLSNDLAINNGEEVMTYTFTATTLANVNLTIETELYNSRASCHMSPYQHKFHSY